MREIIENLLLKMRKTLVASICKVIPTKIEDFDEVMLVFQVGKLEVKDVLLDGGFGGKCEHHIWKFKEETQFEEVSTNSFCNKTS